MPPGWVHYKYWKRGMYIIPPLSIIFLIGVVSAGFTWQEFLPYVLWTNFHYFMGRYIDPDLDVLSFTAADNRMIRELGPVGLALSAYWTVYAWLMFAIVKMFGRAHPKYGAHRSQLTHTFFPGTMIRIVFFNAPLYAMITGFEFLSSRMVMASLYAPAIPYIVGQIIGLGLADTLHIHLDKTRKYNEFPTFAPR